MSFSDFGRTAMAALSSTTSSAIQPPPSGVSKSRRNRRSSDPLPPRRSAMDRKDVARMPIDERRRTKSSRDVGGGGDPKLPLLGSQSSRRRRSDGGAIVDHHRAKGAITNNNNNNNKNKLEIHRGVRPRLDHIQCPVTKKTLMDDVLTIQGDDEYNDASLASTSISSSTTTEQDYSYDDDSADQHSDSDIGLNHRNSRDEVSRSKHNSSKNRSSSNSRRITSHLDGRKIGRPEREPERDPRVHNSSHRRSQRRFPKHYNNVTETAADRGRTTTSTKKRHDSQSKKKGADKKQSNNTNRQSQTSKSSSTKLSTEIAQFQKMVADLESVLESSASSPEAMWKSRILLRSARDAERDLKPVLEKEEREGAAEMVTKSVAAAAKAAARKKMQRDYHRASEQLRSIVEETERRQRAEISCLTASEAAAAGVNPEGEAAAAAQKRAVMGPAEAEEDFFDRAMRERQAEVQKISDGMKKVQEIYTDLAGLVDGQQDQIDQLEDINEEVKADTRAGLEEIQHGMWKLCAADQHEKDRIGANGPQNSFVGATDRNRKKKVLDPSDILNCMMACNGHSESQGGGGVLSLDEDLYHERTTTTITTAQQSSKQSNENYYRDDVQDSESTWNLLNLEDVQESAQDAYQRGHAIVGGLVGQVHEVVASGEFRDVGNRLSCTPQPEEYSSSENTDDSASNEIGFEERGTTNKSSDKEYYWKEAEVDEECDHHSESQGRRSRSRHSSRSHSKPRQKHQNNHYQQHEPEQWKEDDYREHNKTQSKKERPRRKGRKSSSR